MERSPRKPLAALTSDELQQRALEYRGMAANARGAVATALRRLAIRYWHLAIHREMEETTPLQSTRNECRNQTEVARLVASANRVAACEPNPIRSLVTTIRVTAASSADPYLAIGVLLEGTVHTICTRIPQERRVDTAIALLQLLNDRLSVNKMLPMI
jgi:hypothetical protein